MSAESVATADPVREAVRDKYAASARRVAEAGECGCGPSCCRTESDDPVTSNLYAVDEVAAVPGAAIAASLGCGVPTAVAGLRDGETVLDLGSGAGADVLIAARRVGTAGRAIGLDMTDEMLALARENATRAGVRNAEFLHGHIEDIPLPDASVDVVISNCVINLSADKPRVISEAYRVLKPGARFAVSDMVFLGDKGKLPNELVRSMEAWSGCVSGALEKDEYEKLLREAGFEDVSVEVTHTYDEEFVAASGATSGCCGGSGCCGDTAAATEVPLASAFIRGRKPAERGTP